jgi:hypothetical protein
VSQSALEVDSWLLCGMAANKKDIREVGSTGNMPVGIVLAFAWESPLPMMGVGVAGEGNRRDRERSLAMIPGQVGVNLEGQLAAWPQEEGVR